MYRSTRASEWRLWSATADFAKQFQKIQDDYDALAVPLFLLQTFSRAHGSDWVKSLIKASGSAVYRSKVAGSTVTDETLSQHLRAYAMAQVLQRNFGHAVMLLENAINLQPWDQALLETYNKVRDISAQGKTICMDMDYSVLQDLVFELAVASRAALANVCQGRFLELLRPGSSRAEFSWKVVQNARPIPYINSHSATLVKIS